MLKWLTIYISKSPIFQVWNDVFDHVTTSDTFISVISEFNDFHAKKTTVIHFQEIEDIWFILCIEVQHLYISVMYMYDCCESPTFTFWSFFFFVILILFPCWWNSGNSFSTNHKARFCKIVDSEKQLNVLRAHSC